MFILLTANITSVVAKDMLIFEIAILVAVCWTSNFQYNNNQWYYWLIQVIVSLYVCVYGYYIPDIGTHEKNV